MITLMDKFIHLEHKLINILALVWDFVHYIIQHSWLSLLLYLLLWLRFRLRIVVWGEWIKLFCVNYLRSFLFTCQFRTFVECLKHPIGFSIWFITIFRSVIKTSRRLSWLSTLHIVLGNLFWLRWYIIIFGLSCLGTFSRSHKPLIEFSTFTSKHNFSSQCKISFSKYRLRSPRLSLISISRWWRRKLTFSICGRHIWTKRNSSGNLVLLKFVNYLFLVLRKTQRSSSALERKLKCTLVIFCFLTLGFLSLRRFLTFSSLNYNTRVHCFTF